MQNRMRHGHCPILQIVKGSPLAEGLVLSDIRIYIWVYNTGVHSAYPWVLLATGLGISPAVLVWTR